MGRRWLVFVAFGFFVAAALGYRIGRVSANGIPQTGTLAYSGSLLTFGQPDNNTHLIGLTLYLSGGAATSCVVPATNIQVTNGQFTVPLPESCVTTIHQNPGLDVQINIDGIALGMQPITAVPYAVESDTTSALTTDTSGGTTCSSAGHVRFTGQHFQGCNGTSWIQLDNTSNTSCLAILNGGGSTGNGSYSLTTTNGINLTAYCDMTTAGGGWTEVWQESSTNSDNTSIPYFANTSGSPSIISQSSNMMFAFINPSAVTPASNGLTQPWYFPTPAAFISTSPMQIAQCNYQTITATRVADGSQITDVLRSGWGSFGSYCDDECANTWGQICLKSNASDGNGGGASGGYSDFPQFTGFAANVADDCAQSNQAYTTTACSTTRLFAIFVR